MPQPFEVGYTTIGKRREREVIGVLCPTPIALHLGFAEPIFTNMGDVTVDWALVESDGYRAMFEWPSSNARLTGATPVGGASELKR